MSPRNPAQEGAVVLQGTLQLPDAPPPSGRLPGIETYEFLQLPETGFQAYRKGTGP